MGSIFSNVAGETKTLNIKNNTEDNNVIIKDSNEDEIMLKKITRIQAFIRGHQARNILKKK